MKNDEYVLLEFETHKTLQCKLNQWRHDYRLRIIWVDKHIRTLEDGVSKKAEYFALIMRNKK